MQTTRWNQRFLTSTRGRIVTLLRRSSRTVSELAEALDLTDNGVRSHLAALERDGIVEVEPHAVRRGVGKPAYLYGLTPAAESIFTKAYAPVLRVLLDVLADRLEDHELEEVMREAGRRAVAGRTEESDTRERLEAAVAVLGELGGMAELEEAEDGWLIRGYSCPLAAVVPGHPEACWLAESLLAELIGMPVRACCDRGERARCCFRVPRSGLPA